MQVIYISDGKAGHRSQALGLFAALKRQYLAAEFLEIGIDKLSYRDLLTAMFSRTLPYILNSPDVIISVGSHTHLKAWLLGKIYSKAKTIVMMKPSLPLACFDYAIIPAHDGITGKNVIVTEGALNPIVNQQRHQKNRILIALGGSSKRHQWSDEQVMHSVKQIIAQHSDAQIIITSSRRTPKAFFTQLSSDVADQHVTFFPVEDTPTGWIFEQMQLAEAVWITEDSISMLYEALTAGCRVGVIGLTRLKDDRITRAIDRLKAKNYISAQTSITALAQAATLHEADKVVTHMQLTSANCVDCG